MTVLFNFFLKKGLISQFGFVAILHRSLLIRNLLCCRLPAAIHVHYTLCKVYFWSVMGHSESESDGSSVLD